MWCRIYRNYSDL